jgi:hypothetical protein
MAPKLVKPASPKTASPKTASPTGGPSQQAQQAKAAKKQQAAKQRQSDSDEEFDHEDDANDTTNYRPSGGGGCCGGHSHGGHGHGSSASDRLAKMNAESGEEGDKEEEEAEDPMPSKGHYILISIVALFFTTLPLGEQEIDWVQTAAFAVANLVWIGYFHRATFLHCLIFFLVNFIIIQWQVLAVTVPKLLEEVDPVHGAIGLGANAVVIFLVWFQYVRHLPKNKRLDAWDWIACVIGLGNIVILVALGIIPMSAVYQVFKTLVSVLSSGQVK